MISFKQLPANERTLAKDLVGPGARQPFNMKDLPPMVLGKFTERDGSVGNLVLVEPPLGNVSDDGDKLIAFIKELRDTADSVSPGAPVAGTLPISSDMIESIVRDGPKATLFAFLAVVALVIILFRRPGIFLPIIFGLIMGVGWLIGFILIFWYKVNFLNFIALPITFGIGVDYAVNVFSRFREEGPNSLVKVLRDTGGAVMLCSFTTGIGYGSLLIAQNQAFVSFGVLAVVGEITCLVAAMFSLPSLLLFF
ncbi:MAG: RND transporter, partial [Proteobacteria bacterium]